MSAASSPTVAYEQEPPGSKLSDGPEIKKRRFPSNDPAVEAYYAAYEDESPSDNRLRLGGRSNFYRARPPQRPDPIPRGPQPQFDYLYESPFTCIDSATGAQAEWPEDTSPDERAKIVRAYENLARLQAKYEKRSLRAVETVKSWRSAPSIGTLNAVKSQIEDGLTLLEFAPSKLLLAVLSLLEPPRVVNRIDDPYPGFPVCRFITSRPKPDEPRPRDCVKGLRLPWIKEGAAEASSVRADKCREAIDEFLRLRSTAATDIYAFRTWSRLVGMSVQELSRLVFGGSPSAPEDLYPRKPSPFEKLTEKSTRPEIFFSGEIAPTTAAVVIKKTPMTFQKCPEHWIKWCGRQHRWPPSLSKKAFAKFRSQCLDKGVLSSDWWRRWQVWCREYSAHGLIVNRPASDPSSKQAAENEAQILFRIQNHTPEHLRWPKRLDWVPAFYRGEFLNPRFPGDTGPAEDDRREVRPKSGGIAPATLYPRITALFAEMTPMTHKEVSDRSRDRTEWARDVLLPALPVIGHDRQIRSVVYRYYISMTNSDQADFCRFAGINRTQLGNWLGRFRSAPGEPAPELRSRAKKSADNLLNSSSAISKRIEERFRRLIASIEHVTT